MSTTEVELHLRQRKVRAWLSGHAISLAVAGGLNVAI